MEKQETDSFTSGSLSNRTYVVVANQRIESLRAFYVKRDPVVLEDELSAKDKINEDTQGKWATTRFAEAAKKLHLAEFVTKPIGAGYEIPTIPNRCEYEIAHRAMHEKEIADSELTFPRRRKYIDIKSAQLSEVEDKIEKARVSSEKTKKIEELEALRDKLYDEWEKRCELLTKDTTRIEIIKEKCKEKGSKQFDEDTDARNNLELQLNRLKSYLAVLMKKVPIIRSVVNAVDKKGKNPYEEMDLRTVYSNLMNRFRCNDQLQSCLV
jgi:hypothetical protein